MELNTIQTEGTWNEVAERLNDNFRKILLAIQNGAGGGDDDDGDSKIVTIDLDPSKLVQGEEVELTQEQRETLCLAREGYTVFTTCYMDYSGSIQPWGQVISCIQTDLGSSTHVNTITIVSRDGKNFDEANGLIVYTIDNFDAYYSRVTSIIRLSDINNKADKATTLSGYGIEDAYTKDEVYSKDEISAAITREVTDKTRDFYTRSEVKEMYALKEDVATELNNKVDKVEGKQLSTEDFTAALKAKLQGLSNYDDTELANAVAQLQTTLDTLIGSNPNVAINSFNEIIAFLSGIRDSENLDSIIASIEQQIASKQNTITDLETIREGAALGATAVQPEGLTDMVVQKVAEKTRDFPTRSEVKEMYALKEDVATELNNKVDKDEVYSKDEMSEAITREVTDKTRDFYTRSEVKEMYALKEDVATELNNKVDKVEGKQLSTEDFTAALKAKLQGLSNYDDTELANAVAQLQTTLDTLIGSNPNVAINSFNEIIAFLSGIRDSENLDSIIASIEQQIASKQNTITDLETIREGAALGATAVQPEGLTDMVVQKVAEKTRDFPTRSEVKETYAYRDKDDIQEILGISDWALSSENPSYAKAEMDTKLGLKQDNLESGINIKTINGQSILGSGDIDIGGGGGELNVVAISLDVTKLTAGNYVTITREQYDQLLLSRKGYPVVIADANFPSGNYAYESEWGQVISCYRQYFGSSAFVYRLSVIHHAGDVGSNTPNTQIYTMEVMDMTTGGGSSSTYLYVRAIKNLY